MELHRQTRSKNGITFENGSHAIHFPYEFFYAQAAFAKRWSQFSSESLRTALTLRTSLEDIFLDANVYNGHFASSWMGLLHSVDRQLSVDEIASIIQKYYLTTPGKEYDPFGPIYDGDKHFGPFSYSMHSTVAHIHFSNTHRGSKSDLDIAYLDERKKDIGRLIRKIMATHPEIKTIAGFSWLYNLPAYLRIFPPTYVRSLSCVLPPPLDSNAIWEQFLAKDGFIKQTAYNFFLMNIEKAQTREDLYTAFPFQVMRPQDSIGNFARYYGVQLTR